MAQKLNNKVKYLRCILDESLSDESMALNKIDKIHSHLKFLQRQNHFLTPLLHRLLCNCTDTTSLILHVQLGFEIFQKKLRLRLN